MSSFSTRFPLLQDMGLSTNEALIYELLLEKGSTKPADLVEPSGLGRGNIYNILQQLLQKNLVAIKELGKFQVYEAVDPSQLQDLLTRKHQEITNLESAFQAALPQLTSLFRLSTGKPAIQVFEGLEGMKAVLEDSLTAKSEILTWFDPEAMTDAFAAINQAYVKNRVRAKKSKRILLPAAPQSAAYQARMQNAYTDIRLANNQQAGFGLAVEVYDAKVSFHVLNPAKPIAFIIENEAVAQFQRTVFEPLWQTSVSTQLPTQPQSNESAGDPAQRHSA